MREIIVRSDYARRMPDPTRPNAERHFLMVRARDIPADIPTDPNPRAQKLNLKVYREVAASLQGIDTDDDTFHLKNKGISIIADDVKKRGDGVYALMLEEGQGIIDGGHTYSIIRESLDAEDAEVPENQFVLLDVRVGYDESLFVDMAGGLNTSLQVQPMSLDNLQGEFDWLKDLLAAEPYANNIAWRENDDGLYDARDLLSFLLCYNVRLNPADSDEHPLVAYDKKSEVLRRYERNKETFLSLAPIVKDILTLHDMVHVEAHKQWNKDGGRFGQLNFVESRQRGEFQFIFIGEQSQHRLTRAAFYPIFGAFRSLVHYDEGTGSCSWIGGFDHAKKVVQGSMVQLVQNVLNSTRERGRNESLTALGRSKNLWQLNAMTVRVKQGSMPVSV
jgi:hypothetical protein